jgi:predicted DNA-binding WGR domain protein
MAVKTAPIHRFEYVRGSSDKFWECQVTGDTVTVRFGRNGSAGQTLTKRFLNDAAARLHAEKAIALKIVKGYREIQ